MHTIRYRYNDGPAQTMDVENYRHDGVRLLRVRGLPTAEVRDALPGERQLIVDAPYAATWLGWHRGQCPAYGCTPEDAVRKLAAGEVAS